MKQKPYFRRTYFIPLPIEFIGKEPCTFAGPPQRRFGIATHDRINEGIQDLRQFHIMFRQIFSPAARTTGLQRRQLDRTFQFLDSFSDRRHGNSRCLLHDTDASPSELSGFDSTPKPLGTLGERRRHELKFFLNITNNCVAFHAKS